MTKRGLEHHVADARSLARAVIGQALADVETGRRVADTAHSTARQREQAVEARRALAWLTTDARDVAEWRDACAELADVSLDRVRAVVTSGDPIALRALVEALLHARG